MFVGNDEGYPKQVTQFDRFPAQDQIWRQAAQTGLRRDCQLVNDSKGLKNKRHFRRTHGTN